MIAAFADREVGVKFIDDIELRRQAGFVFTAQHQITARKNFDKRCGLRFVHGDFIDFFDV